MKLRLQSNISWLLMLIAHAVAATAWWWFMPGGFPISHPRFWVNEALPVVLICATIAALTMARRGELSFARAALLLFAITWFGMSIAGRLLYPISMRGMFILPGAAGGVCLFTAFGPAVRSAALRRPVSVASAIVGFVIGGWLPMTQRAELASTHPINEPLPTGVLQPIEHHLATQSLRGFDVNPSQAMINPQRGRFAAYIQPLLTFHSRSPDRFWTCFAPPAERMGPIRELTGYAATDGVLTFAYKDDGESRLTVRDAASGSAEIEAISKLPAAVYSHLNSFCEMQFSGYRKLFVAFSPCPETKIEVTNFDYPIGRPARFAYVDANRHLRVVEGRSGEKGPFRTLAEGILKADEQLAITLYNEEAPISRLTLRDFAAQCSTALSPTAGWRVPANAIEFSRDSEDPAPRPASSSRSPARASGEASTVLATRLASIKIG